MVMANYMHLLKQRPLLPQGLRIRIKIVIDGHQGVCIRCRVHEYDPVFELLKLQTTNDSAMSAYFRLLGDLEAPPSIGPIKGVKTIQLKWLAKAHDVERTTDDGVKIKLYFRTQYDQEEESKRLVSRSEMSDQTYLALVEKFEKVIKKAIRSGTKPHLTQIIMRASQRNKRRLQPHQQVQQENQKEPASVPSKLLAATNEFKFIPRLADQHLC